MSFATAKIVISVFFFCTAISGEPSWNDWSEWGAYQPYSQTCGKGATRTRTRTCSKPNLCEGSDTNTEPVYLDPCPVEAHWSEWGAYGPYSKTCGEGATRTRTRTCSVPNLCLEGPATETETKNLEACPACVDRFGDWCKKKKEKGHCTDRTRSKLMQEHCASTCETCGVEDKCYDEYNQCRHFANKEGYCDESSEHHEFMNKYCPYSCQVCPNQE